MRPNSFSLSHYHLFYCTADPTAEPGSAEPEPGTTGGRNRTETEVEEGETTKVTYNAGSDLVTGANGTAFTSVAPESDTTEQAGRESVVGMSVVNCWMMEGMFQK